MFRWLNRERPLPVPDTDEVAALREQIRHIRQRFDRDKFDLNRVKAHAWMSGLAELKEATGDSIINDPNRYAPLVALKEKGLRIQVGDIKRHTTIVDYKLDLGVRGPILRIKPDKDHNHKVSWKEVPGERIPGHILRVTLLLQEGINYP